MTAEPTNYAAGLEAPAGASLWRHEMRATVKLALPIALTQRGQVAMMTSDLILIGRLGDVAIAGAALAHIILFACFVLGMGLMSAVSPPAARARPGRNRSASRRPVSAGPELAPGAGLLVHRPARLHGRGEPSRAGFM